MNGRSGFFPQLCTALRVLAFFCLAARQATVLAEPPKLPTPKGVKQSIESAPVPTPHHPLVSNLPAHIEEDFTLHQAGALQGRIAFSAKVDEMWRIFILDLDENRVRLLVEGPGNNYHPSFSPDGKYLSFLSDRSGQAELYVTSWLGTTTRQLTFSRTEKEHPQWMTNGPGVIFSTYSPETNSTTFWLHPVDSGPLHQLAQRPGKNLTPHMSPDASTLSYSTDRSWPGLDICILELKELKEQCILTGDKTFERPKFSHKGDDLAVSYGDARNRDIGLYSMSGKGFKKVTTLPRRETDPEWSTDDRYIAFVADAEKVGNFDIWLYDRATDTSRVLLSTHYTIRYLSWSPVRTIDLEIARIKLNENLIETPAAENSPAQSLKGPTE